MADPDITALQIVRNNRAPSQLTDPVTGAARMVGSPALAVDLSNVAWMTEDEQ